MADVYDPGGGGEQAYSNANFFYCDNQSRNPHHSSHQPGWVNAEGWMWCSDSSVSVSIRSKLWKEFAWFWFTELADSGVRYGVGAVNVFVNYPCQGNLNYRITTTHTAANTFPNPVQTRNTKYVVCQ